jgi:hypothetical protein
VILATSVGTSAVIVKSSSESKILTVLVTMIEVVFAGDFGAAMFDILVVDLD